MNPKYLLYPPSMTFWCALQSGYIKETKNERYLAFVRTLPCCICGERAEPHHIVGGGLKGVGEKTPDILAIPLCRAHHDRLHQKGHVEWGVAYRSQLEFSAMTLCEAVMRGVLVVAK